MFVHPYDNWAGVDTSAAESVYVILSGVIIKYSCVCLLVFFNKPHYFQLLQFNSNDDLALEEVCVFIPSYSLCIFSRA